MPAVGPAVLPVELSPEAQERLKKAERLPNLYGAHYYESVIHDQDEKIKKLSNQVTEIKTSQTQLLSSQPMHKWTEIDLRRRNNEQKNEIERLQNVVQIQRTDIAQEKEQHQMTKHQAHQTISQLLQLQADLNQQLIDKELELVKATDNFEQRLQRAEAAIAARDQAVENYQTVHRELQSQNNEQKNMYTGLVSRLLCRVRAEKKGRNAIRKTQVTTERRSNLLQTELDQRNTEHDQSRRDFDEFKNKYNQLSLKHQETAEVLRRTKTLLANFRNKTRKVWLD